MPTASHIEAPDLFAAKRPSITGIAMRLTRGGPIASKMPRSSLAIFSMKSGASLRRQMMDRRTRVGIASHQELRDRALRIARGELRRGPNEPKIWFTSLESLAKVLSESNRELLRVIDKRRPKSLAELE